jgi:hypothetical protein
MVPIVLPGNNTFANAMGKPSVSFTVPLTLVWACRTTPVSHKRNTIYFFIVGLNGYINTKQKVDRLGNLRLKKPSVRRAVSL